MNLEEVSIHAPTWGATRSIPSLPRMSLFQSTHPRGVRHSYMGKTVKQTAFQSTHPRGVRRFRGRHRFHYTKFQSTHPRGVRRGRIAVFRNHSSFNPRTHVGCDVVFGNVVRIVGVSIHAPTWGATQHLLNIFKTILWFQSTHPRGVRPTEPRSIMPSRCFNPRTHVGCDWELFYGGSEDPVSIHAPTWGATQQVQADRKEYEFQSTHPRGVRRGPANRNCQEG